VEKSFASAGNRNMPKHSQLLASTRVGTSGLTITCYAFSGPSSGGKMLDFLNVWLIVLDVNIENL
jgi:hypothetical protein